MKKKEKIILSGLVIVSVLIAFVVGILAGSKTRSFSKKEIQDKYITFFSSKKYFGKETSKEEKQAIAMFVAPYEECFKNTLNNEEIKIIKNLQKEVIEMSKNNKKIKFKINDLKSVNKDDNLKKAVLKTRKCQRVAYKHMTKSDKRLFWKALSKLSIDNVISIFHGVK